VSLTTVLVIDTSYLLELYQVPSFFSPAAHQEVKARFDRAVENRSRLYVPFPAIFEVANHIVDGRDGGARVALAQLFVLHVLQSFETTVPFIITPAIDEENLKTLLRVFSGELAHERIGLTDGSMIEEARRLKVKYGAHARVHIWTRDKRLKAREPDREPSPFV
jgi:predicted nucleic acid-binding protein